MAMSYPIQALRTLLFGVMLGIFLSISPLFEAWAADSRATRTSALMPMLDNPRDSSSLRINGDLFVHANLSVGEASPVIPDPSRSWQTVQAKLWFDMPTSFLSARLFVQSGLGVLQPDPFLQSQNSLGSSSWLLPLGIGLDDPRADHSLLTMFSLNVSELRSGPQNGTHLMPGLLLGIRF
jgi:hypothetical protein